MKTYSFQNKKIVNVPYCLSQLQAANPAWANGIVAAQNSNPPCACVTVDDAAPDPSPFVNAYIDPPVLVVTSDAPIGTWSLPQVPSDGVAQQTLTVKTFDPYTGQPVPSNAQVLVFPHTPLPCAPLAFNLVNGVGQVVAGPTSIPGEYDIFFKMPQYPRSDVLVHIVFAQ